MAELLFGWWQYEFMRNAFLALLLIMPLFAMLGTLIVNNGMAFFSDALGHSSLTGVGLGVILGFSGYKPAMIVFAIIFALLMNRIRHSRLYSTDTVIGVFSACGVALGLLLLSFSGNFSRYQSLLIGDILSITKSEIIILAVTLIGIIIMWLIFFNRFHLISISPAIASSRGIKVNLLDNLFVDNHGPGKAFSAVYHAVADHGYLIHVGYNTVFFAGQYGNDGTHGFCMVA